MTPHSSRLSYTRGLFEDLDFPLYNLYICTRICNAGKKSGRKNAREAMEERDEDRKERNGRPLALVPAPHFSRGNRVSAARGCGGGCRAAADRE